MVHGTTDWRDYEAAKAGAAVGLRRDRRFLRVTGRSPGEMLSGLLTNRVPPPLRQERGQTSGEVLYSTLLTSKARIITDLRILADPEEGFLLDLPEVGMEGALRHFRTYLPPRLARIADPDKELSILTVVGPDAPAMVANVWSDWVLDGFSDPTSGLSAEEIHALREGEELVFHLSDDDLLRVLANGELSSEAWDLLLPGPGAARMQEALLDQGAIRLSEGTREILRVEKGRPAFGKDMDQDTIPVEAGIHRRAIDDGKGCYTGQEVVVRIRDRGHVNRSLRGLVFSASSVPDPGEEIFIPDREKPAGRVTSSVWSPGMDGPVGMGYVRRGVEAGQIVRIGTPDGSEAEVRDLGDQGWIDPS